MAFTININVYDGNKNNFYDTDTQHFYIIY